jgi:rubredoxin
MSSKNKWPGKCQKCGWIYPAAYGLNTCKFCGGGVYRDVKPEPGYCRVCGKYCENIHKNGNRLCSQCNSKVVEKSQKAQPDYRERRNEINKKMWHTYRATAIQKYNDWLEQLNKITTHSLTEEEWLQACSHFNGCAWCGSESIDARTYFINYSDGGKYNACNVVPACDKCANDIKKNPNPFLRMDREFNESKALLRGQNKHNLQCIVDYLQCKIEEATNESAGKD